MWGIRIKLDLFRIEMSEWPRGRPLVCFVPEALGPYYCELLGA